MALSHGINANIVHRWLREQTPSALSIHYHAFVPVTREEPAPSPAPLTEPDIRVEVQRANATIVVKWPLRGGVACAAWLRESLK